MCIPYLCGLFTLPEENLVREVCAPKLPGIQHDIRVSYSSDQRLQDTSLQWWSPWDIMHLHPEIAALKSISLQHRVGCHRYFVNVRQGCRSDLHRICQGMRAAVLRA